MAGSSVELKDKAIEQPEATMKPVDYKVPIPEPFDGNRTKLKSFLLKCDLYMGFNGYKFVNETDRILWVTTLLKGPAFDWMEPHVTDYIDNKGPNGELVEDNMFDETLTIFRSFKGFKKRISRVFGDIDQERNSERFLENLKQRGSAATYTAEFQQHSGRTDWDDTALRWKYYQGLKDAVKDEIARSDRPTTLQGLIELAIKIDNRNYERRLEKSGQKASWSNSKKPKRNNNWPQPMELDATQKPSQTKDTKKDRQYKERLCFNCNKPGHIARNCQQKREKGKQLNATHSINMVSKNEFNWNVDSEDREDYQDVTTDLEERELPEITFKDCEEWLHTTCFKDQIPNVIKQVYLTITLQKKDIPAPPQDEGWNPIEWTRQIKEMRKREDYDESLEPRGSVYMEAEAAKWYDDKLTYYSTLDKEPRDASTTQLEQRYKERTARLLELSEFKDTDIHETGTPIRELQLQDERLEWISLGYSLEKADEFIESDARLRIEMSKN